MTTIEATTATKSAVATMTEVMRSEMLDVASLVIENSSLLRIDMGRAPQPVRLFRQVQHRASAEQRNPPRANFRKCPSWSLGCHANHIIECNGCETDQELNAPDTEISLP